MRVTGAMGICGRLAATAALLLILAATAGRADSFGPDGDVASAAAREVPMLAADLGSGIVEMAAMSDAPLIDAVAVAADRSTEARHDGDAKVGQDVGVPTFLDQLVTQYFESYN